MSSQTPPVMIAALDESQTVIGIYAVNPETRELPGVKYATLIDFPEEPQKTGQTVEVPVNPVDPSRGTVPVDILAWPEAGWSYSAGYGWKPPPR